MDSARSSFLLETLGRLRVITHDMYDPQLRSEERHAKVACDVTDLYTLIVSEYWEEVYRCGQSPKAAWDALSDATTQDGMVAGDERERFYRGSFPVSD